MTRTIVLAGVTQGPVCGVRDHTNVLAKSFLELGFDPQIVWEDLPSNPGLREVHGANRRLAHRIRVHGKGACATVLQYSVFSYAYKGIPVGLRSIVGALADLDCRTVAYLHEYAYPWAAAPRDLVWATTQRMALRGLISAADVVALTTEKRAALMSAQRWLPKRPNVFAPASSTLPFLTHLTAPTSPKTNRLGVIGFGASSARPSVLLEAIATLIAGGLEIEVVLIGSPGPGSNAAARWRKFAIEAGLDRCLAFSGVLSTAELADAMASCSLAVFTDRAGVDGRRTSVAACLSLGVPVLALDGPDFWRLLTARGALLCVPPDCQVIATEIRRLLDDPVARREQAARGRKFFDGELAPVAIAERLLAAMNVGTPMVR